MRGGGPIERYDQPMAPVSETISIGVDGTTLPTSEIMTGRAFLTGKSGSGKSNSASVIAEELLERGLPLLIVDTDGEYLGLKERYDLHHVGKGDGADTDLDEADPAKLAELGLERNVPVILDISGVLDADVGADMARRVIEQLFQTGNRVRKPFLVIVEEIHEFLPESGKRGDISETLLRVAKRGRKRGIGLLGISQRPAAVDKDFITQCDWIVWHRLTWDNDTRVVQRMIGGEYADAVQELDTGEAFLMADWDDSIRRVRFRRKRTKDIGATPGLERFESTELDAGSDGAVQHPVAEPADDDPDDADEEPIELTAEPVEDDEEESPRWEPWPGHDQLEPETPAHPRERDAETNDPIAEVGHFMGFVVHRLLGSVRAAGRGLNRAVPDPAPEGSTEQSEPLSVEFVAEAESPRRALAVLAVLAATAILVAWLLMA